MEAVSQSHGSEMWSVKYCPQRSREVCGNHTAVTFLHEWLRDWKDRISLEGTAANSDMASQPTSQPLSRSMSQSKAGTRGGGKKGAGKRGGGGRAAVSDSEDEDDGWFQVGGKY
jgi:hypothetical protein